jgi:cytoskeletal protein RodZ
VAFVKGFLRAYAQALGVDGEDVVRRYEESLHNEETLAAAEAELTQLNQRFWPRLLLSLVNLVILMALSILVVSISENPLMRIQTDDPSLERPLPSAVAPTNDTPTETEKSPDEPAETEASPASQPLPKAEPHGPVVVETPRQGETPEPELDNIPLAGQVPRASVTETGADPVRLQIQAHEETWLQVKVDDRDAKSYQLQPGANLELQATSGFELLVGNAGGITLVLNDLPLPPLGRSGRVVTLKLP